jgi:8-oxo-dGTP pyrophosphatase MutT (NUDIX family)
VLLLRNKGGFWDFPKGAAEMADNNNLMQTAFRELLEETSLTEKDVKAIRQKVSFSYEYRVHKRLKRVKLFLAELKEHVMYKKLYYDGTEIFTHRFVELQDLHTYFFWEEDIKVSRTIIAHLKHLIEKT